MRWPGPPVAAVCRIEDCNSLQFYLFLLKNIFKKIIPNVLFKLLCFQTLGYFCWLFLHFLQNVLTISVLVWYLKCFIGLRKCSDCGRFHHLHKSFWGPRRPPEPQPKIKGNTMIATLSKFVCTHPPPPQMAVCAKREKMETSIHQHQELFASVVISAVRLLQHEQNVGKSKVHTGNKWNYGSIWKVGFKKKKKICKKTLKMHVNA